MLTEPFTDVTLQWATAHSGGQNALRNGADLITFCPAISCWDADQLGLLVIVGANAQDARMRLQWNTGVDVNVDANDATWAYERVEIAGTVSAGVLPYSLAIKEWQLPVDTSEVPAPIPYMIWRPAAAHVFRVGVYSNGAPGVNDLVTLVIERQRGGQLQAAAT